MCTSWQHEFSASRKWRQSKKRVLFWNESFIVTLYLIEIRSLSMWIDGNTLFYVLPIQVAVVVVLVATNVAAQHLAWPYGTTIVPAGAVTPVVAVKEPSTVFVKSLVENPVQMKGLFGVPVSSIYPYPHVVQVAIPSQDTTRGMPQPVEDTPEVLFIPQFVVCNVTHKKKR
jgi:hypothetical protein